MSKMAFHTGHGEEEKTEYCNGVTGGRLRWMVRKGLPEEMTFDLKPGWYKKGNLETF